ncbi:translation factor GTPase family protein [Intestinibacter sp.]|uniref:translation factor GTPase family protein n=1 Tax=Intestinibacter sp. TaxID=1965304 RepID=UPI002A916F26|nr:translation factor GTPase family protein [Intestinibacter sp.]MDY5211605.1 translation factor GTPase family protein [Intestinibacter sp.]
MIKTIGILAHVDAGKTSLSEQILYHTKSIRSRGRVDHKNTFLDNYEIERKRGITVFSKIARFFYNENEYFLVDTPGHIDFSGQMERSLDFLDYAILVVSGVQKVQSHTSTVFKLLKKKKIPTFIFINKIDSENCFIEDVFEDIREKLDSNIVELTDELKKEDFSEEVIDFIAERDENLMEIYFESGYNRELWNKNLIKQIKSCNIYPVFRGSALDDIGIESFIDALDKLTITSYKKEDEFIAKVCNIKYEDKNKEVYIKVLSGSLNVKDEVKYFYKDEIIEEKINSIFLKNGDKKTISQNISAGQIGAIVGVTNLQIGQYITLKSNENIDFLKQTRKDTIIPTLRTKVIFDENLNVKDVLEMFKILEAEEPSLNVAYSEKLKEISISIMGKVQLEILKEFILNRFGIKVDFGKCEILYKESINTPCIGSGHYEPLKHYAEVHLKIEPNKRGGGIVFESKAHVDDLDIGSQNLVKTHVFERKHHGVLCGFDLDDLRITLITGRDHKKHTSGGDFRQATYRAIRQGVEQCESIILEPFYTFEIEVEDNYLGRVMSDIQRLNGTFDIPQSINNKSIITGRGPVSTFMDYQLELISFTKGTGRISLNYDGYDECHNTEEVIKNKNYNKDSDEDFTSNSIFCSKGTSYSVKGSEIKDYMHCDVEELIDKWL